MLEQYRKHVAERAAEGIVPKPLDAEQVAALVELIKQPPCRGRRDSFSICWQIAFLPVLMKRLMLKRDFWRPSPRAKSVRRFWTRLRRYRIIGHHAGRL